MKTFYFTFGQTHTHPTTGEKLKDYYVKVVAKTKNEAIIAFESVYDKQYASHYDSENFPFDFFPSGLYETIYA